MRKYHADIIGLNNLGRSFKAGEPKSHVRDKKHCSENGSDDCGDQPCWPRVPPPLCYIIAEEIMVLNKFSLESFNFPVPIR